MADWRERLTWERADLSKRLDGLNWFIEANTKNRNSSNVAPAQLPLLEAQQHAMSLYLQILDMRLAQLKAPKKMAVAFVKDPSGLIIDYDVEITEVGGHSEDRDGPVSFGG